MTTNILAATISFSLTTLSFASWSKPSSREEGREEGRVEIQHQMIVQLLQFRFDLTEVEQQHYVQQVAAIRELQHLNELANILLDKSSQLEDFVEALTSNV